MNSEKAMNNIKYKFSPNISPKAITIIKLIDKVLYFFKGFTKPKTVEHIETITIVQLSHIGDLLLTLPVLKKLKEVTNYKINLVVSGQNYIIAEKVKYIDKIILGDAPYFLRGRKGSTWSFIKQLRKVKTDLLFDVRGDLRNNFFLKVFTKKKIFLGYDVGGGGALLDVALPYPFGQHITNLCNPLLDYLNIPNDALFKYWDVDELPQQVISDFNIEKKKYFVVHLGAAAPSRKWPIENFLIFIKTIAQSIPVYVLGTRHDIDEDSLAALAHMPDVKVGIGHYSILESSFIVKNSVGFLGLDSGFTHFASLSGVKTFVLFAGMADVNVWKPYEIYPGQVTVFSLRPPCSMIAGCGKSICADNICMKEISTFEVVNKVESFLVSEIE